MDKRHHGKPSENRAKGKAEKDGSSAAGTKPHKRSRAEPMPLIISQMPKTGLSREEWDGFITVGLITLWVDRLPPKDLNIVKAQSARLLKKLSWLKRMSGEALTQLDEIIIRQSITLGWRAGLSWLVQWRLSEWELDADGLEMFKRYHTSIQRAVLISQRRETPPLDEPALYPSKTETIKELRVLLRKLRGVFRDRLCDPPADLEPKVVTQFLKVVKKSPKSFPYLAANLDSWQAFLNEQPTELRQLLAEPRLRPASLYYSWLSWSKGVSPEWLRQIISGLGSSQRIPSSRTKLKM